MHFDFNNQSNPYVMDEHVIEAVDVFRLGDLTLSRISS